ncbi:MAG: hypothetical protein AMDU1_APLC00032G0002 [Thermoplasmatales archaeon A-plasma]|nr:MAG: hypothetical protein AMDU1_APLC00032G0002 [Thermoplasmatales archaeon A-plasma]
MLSSFKKNNTEGGRSNFDEITMIKEKILRERRGNCDAATHSGISSTISFR